MNLPANLALIDQIPDDLKSHAQWVGFTVAKDRKKPCIAEHPQQSASCTNPSTWRSFDVAADGLRRGWFNAIAYALNGDFIGIDLDDCLNDGQMNPQAAEVVQRCATFTEVSFSGKGLHILLAGALPDGKGRRQGGVEIYSKNRFLITTGNRLPNSPHGIHTNPVALAWLLNEGSSVTEQTQQIEQIEAIGSPLPPSLIMSVEEVIERTLPQREGERNHRVFDLARGLKFNAGHAGHDVKEMRPFVLRWHTLALPVIRTKDFDTTWSDFIQAWGNARHPFGDALNVAWLESQTAPASQVAANYDSGPVRRLIALCSVLARLTPDGPFFLSARDAAKPFGVDHKQADRWLKMLVADGVLAIQAKGNKRFATRYRWLAA